MSRKGVSAVRSVFIAIVAITILGSGIYLIANPSQTLTNSSITSSLSYSSTSPSISSSTEDVTATVRATATSASTSRTSISTNTRTQVTTSTRNLTRQSPSIIELSMDNGSKVCSDILGTYQNVGKALWDLSKSSCTLTGTEIGTATFLVLRGDVLQIDKGVTLSLNESDYTFANYGTFRNNGTIDTYAGFVNYGDLHNSGVINAHSVVVNLNSWAGMNYGNNTGVIDNYAGGMFNNYFTIENSGVINNYGTINNTGRINNYKCSNTNSSDVGIFNNQGVFKNDGATSTSGIGCQILVVLDTSNGQYICSNGGVILGSWNATSDTCTLSTVYTIANYANLRIGPGVTLIITSSGILNYTGTGGSGFVNNGTLISSGIISSGFYNYGLVNSSGTIMISMNIINNRGVLNNNGIITSDYHYGGLVNNDKVLNNYGIINDYGSISNNGGALYNYGTINNYNGIYNQGGTINNTESGTINNYSYLSSEYPSALDIFNDGAVFNICDGRVSPVFPEVISDVSGNAAVARPCETPVVSIRSGTTINTTTQTISGTADPNAMITLKEGNAQVGQVTADVFGAWSVPTSLAPGTHVLTVQASGFDGASGSISVTVIISG